MEELQAAIVSEDGGRSKRVPRERVEMSTKNGGEGETVLYIGTGRF